MKKTRLSDEIELTEKQRRNIRKNRLIVYPVVSIVIAVVTWIPLVMAAVGGKPPVLLMLIPAAFGLLLLYSGLSTLIRNRKDIVGFFSKDDKGPQV